MYAMQGLTSIEAIAIWVVFGVAVAGLFYAFALRSQILREDKGTEKMQKNILLPQKAQRSTEKCKENFIVAYI